MSQRGFSVFITKKSTFRAHFLSPPSGTLWSSRRPPRGMMIETEHLTYASASPTGKLVIFITGTGALPDRYASLYDVIAGLGHHILVPVYANEDSVNGNCKMAADEAACLGATRLEIIEGNGEMDHSDIVDVSPDDALETRLDRLLAYMVENHGEERWAQFQKDGGVDWSKVIVSGHSQGGGHAVYLAKRHEVARVVNLSSPADTFGAQKEPQSRAPRLP